MHDVHSSHAPLTLLHAMRASKNNRHDTVSDVRLFLEREQPERLKTVEVVCSSARRDMDRQAVHVPYRLFCQTLRLFPECVTDDTVTTRATGWPESTSIACWHDCHPFEGMPIPIPKYSKHNVSSGTSTYIVYGVFCSCNCAVAYILERGTYDQQQQLLLFKQMATTVFGLDTESVFALEPAAPRIFLQLFGGHLSIEDFRRLSLVARSTLLTPPFISYSMVLEENARAGGGSSVSASASASASASMPLGSTASAPVVMPITTHTVRGLRRPTSSSLVNSAGGDTAPAPSEHDVPPPSPFALRRPVAPPPPCEEDACFSAPANNTGTVAGGAACAFEQFVRSKQSGAAGKSPGGRNQHVASASATVNSDGDEDMEVDDGFGAGAAAAAAAGASAATAGVATTTKSAAPTATATGAGGRGPRKLQARRGASSSSVAKKSSGGAGGTAANHHVATSSSSSGSTSGTLAAFFAVN